MKRDEFLNILLYHSKMTDDGNSMFIDADKYLDHVHCFMDFDRIMFDSVEEYFLISRKSFGNAWKAYKQFLNDSKTPSNEF